MTTAGISPPPGGVRAYAWVTCGTGQRFLSVRHTLPDRSRTPTLFGLLQMCPSTSYDILHKLGLTSRTQAALYAVREGLVSAWKTAP